MRVIHLLGLSAALVWASCIEMLFPLPSVALLDKAQQLGDPSQLLFEAWLDWAVVVLLITAGLVASTLLLMEFRHAVKCFVIVSLLYLAWRFTLESPFYRVVISDISRGVFVENWQRVLHYSPSTFVRTFYFNLLVPLFFLTASSILLFTNAKTKAMTVRNREQTTVPE